ncbi:hypothetical protein [Bacteroides sp.]
MSEIHRKLKELPGTAIRKINSIYGSVDKFYATVYLIARNEHQCQMMSVPAANQRIRTIRAYQGLIRFMLDEFNLDGKDIMDAIASDYLEDFVNYREQDFGMSNEEFISIIKRIG